MKIRNPKRKRFARKFPDAGEEARKFIGYPGFCRTCGLIPLVRLKPAVVFS